MKIKSQKDFFSGLLFLVVGLAFAWRSTGYSIGSGAHMGPGYFPLVLGVLLAAIGLFVTFEALVVETEDGDRIGRLAWKPLVFVVVANLVFGVLLAGVPRLHIPALGLVAAAVALTFFAALAGDEFKLLEAAVLSAVLAVGCYVAFVLVLKLQFPAWPTFLAG